MLPARDTRVSLRIHSLYSERIHRSPNHLPARTDIVVSEKDLPESPLSEVGRERIYLVDQMENVERNRASPRRSSRIWRFPAYPEKLRLSRYTENILSNDTGFPVTPIQGARQIFF
jgi:hypothetical protein